MSEPSASTSSATNLEPPSVLVLTKNEEVNIEGCLAGLSFTDDIVVLDSHSTDRTVEIARGFPNVRVVQRPFDIEYRQRNYGLHDIPYRHPWVYICDADERLPPETVRELIETVNAPSQPHAAYRIRFKNFFLGRNIGHASGYPVWIIRLVRPRLVTYEVRETNVHPVVQGSIGELREHFHHFSFNSGLARWFAKHDFYSTREAIEGTKVRAHGLPPLKALRAADPMLRRRTLKNLSYFLRARALWRFLHTYVFRGGWLDGAAGFHYCAMIALYEYWTELKMRQFEDPWDQRTEEAAQRLVGEGRNGHQQDGVASASNHARGVDRHSDVECGRIGRSDARHWNVELPHGSSQRLAVIIPVDAPHPHLADAVRAAQTLGNVFVVVRPGISAEPFSTASDSDHAVTRVEGPTDEQGSLRAWAARHVAPDADWLLLLEPDERVTPALAREIRTAIAQQNLPDALRIPIRLLFMGRQIRHGGVQPAAPIRLFRRGRAFFDGKRVHEALVCRGSVATLCNPLLRLRVREVSTWIERLIDQADRESDDWLAGLRRALQRMNGVARSAVYRRLGAAGPAPGRALWRFASMYVLRLGFLDGRAGWHLARLAASYEYMARLMFEEKLRRAEGIGTQA
jgi:glycosyltransferase involved in cell wall biosynthesis